MRSQATGGTEWTGFGNEAVKTLASQRYAEFNCEIKYCFERTPEATRLGILTNGRKWPLYGTCDYETKTYYEVDLLELLERGPLIEFKNIYLFFQPVAFRETTGKTFLDTVRSEMRDQHKNSMRTSRIPVSPRYRHSRPGL